MDAKSRSKIWKHQMKKSRNVLLFFVSACGLCFGSKLSEISWDKSWQYFLGTDLETKRENFHGFDKKL
jgi:hypothetical protein